MIQVTGDFVTWLCFNKRRFDLGAHFHSVSAPLMEPTALWWIYQAWNHSGYGLKLLARSGYGFKQGLSVGVQRFLEETHDIGDLSNISCIHNSDPLADFCDYAKIVGDV
jgi:hypothetical protein